MAIELADLDRIPRSFLTMAGKPFVVYTFCGELATPPPLYIGRTGFIVERLRAHRRTQPWWPEVEWIDLRFYETEEDADHAERRAICERSPKYNRTRPRPKGDLVPNDLPHVLA